MAEAIADRLVDALHTETLLLADEARSYFAGPGKAARAGMDPRMRVLFTCESLKTTTRLMQLVTWLAGRRLGEEEPPLDEAPASDPAVLADLPAEARRLVLAAIELHGRARRLGQGGGGDMTGSIGPARTLLERLERAF